MKRYSRNKLVYTVKDRCRVCYTCVRECPVKAIRIENGQAEVMGSRCIACGNCVNVCSQGAKAFLEMNNDVDQFLRSGHQVVAAVAPSFPAEFTELETGEFVGMIRALGFDQVVEVSFGADLVAREYNSLLEVNKGTGYISSDCPAIVACIEQHHPDLISSLAPVVSPMVAITRVIKEMYGNHVKVVFIGPCIAKKGESDEIDAAITFTELRGLFSLRKIDNENVPPSTFDPPYAAKGAAFPVSHGLLNTMGKSLDITESSVIVANGKPGFLDAIREFENGGLESSAHLELLCCKGCIMGPGMSKNGNRFNRRTRISKYVQEKLDNTNVEKWEENMERFGKLDLSRQFNSLDQRIDIPSTEDIQKALESIGKFEPKDHLNCHACGYESCREHAIAIHNGLAEPEMCLPYSIEKLHVMVDDLNITNEKLASAKQDLKQSEKLASMGQLSAGIAHELNNPLGVITMYSNILKDEVEQDNPINKDLDLIVEQANRCRSIVGGLLNFARKSQVNLREGNISKFCEHSFQSVIKPKNVTISFVNHMENQKAFFDEDQFMQVLTNLEKNAIEAMPEGGNLSLTIEDDPNTIKITVADSGTGIRQEDMEKVFTPFFTTKGIGKGTGMGLPLAYGIIKMHRGQIRVESNTDNTKGPTGTKFIIELPRKPLETV